MAAACAHSVLCVLVDASLLPFLEARQGPSGLTKESEKEILLSLSLVYRKIARWEEESSIQSEQDAAANPIFGWASSLNSEQSQERCHDCLANIVSVLVPFLTFDSLFVQHMAAKVFLVISSSLSESKSKGLEYFSLLWLSMEAAFSSIISRTAPSSAVRFDTLKDSLMKPIILNKDKVSATYDFGFGITSFVTLLQSRFINVNWLMVADLFQLLHKILKTLKHNDGNLEEVFMHLAVSSLLKLPWCLLDGVHVREEVRRGMSSSKDDECDRKDSLCDSKLVLLGALLQLLCSLVERNDSEVANGFSANVATCFKLADLVPKLLSCCFSKNMASADKGLSQYLQHKALLIMIRLTNHIHWQRQHAILWIKLIKRYFGCLTYKSIFDYDAGYDDSLEGSPFLASNTDGEKGHDLCIRHLQRQAIFVLFKCVFTVVSIYENSGLKCACAREASFNTRKLRICSDQCGHLGLLEFSEWLERCGFCEFVDCESQSRSCSSFALSFLQLFMEEDDMLFGVLLLLLDVRFIQLPIQTNVSRDVAFHISLIFSPIRIFHLFLLLLQYDHLVLVDYLISKDTGVHCLSYLLRCLHIICNSWHFFMEFSLCESDINQPSYKRRKICLSNADRNTSSSSIALERRHIEQDVGLCENQPSHENSGSHTYQNAKACLLSLKRSVEDLHQKNLFPYNPTPLIKSFTNFQELCKQQEASCRT